MHATVIIPYRSRGDDALLEWTLDGYRHQQLEPGNSFDIHVGLDGGDPLQMPEGPTGSAASIQIHTFEQIGAAAVRNALVRQTTAETQFLILANADSRPSATMVQCHIETLSRLPSKMLVLGSAPWERINPSVFDTMIDSTTMIFSYCHMKRHIQYDFRVAYSLNLGLRRQDYLDCGGFPEELRPYYYEDLAFACRLLGPTQRAVVYEPEASVLHRHPLTVDQYLDREELLGMMAPVLARISQPAFARMMANRDVTRLERELRSRTQLDNVVFGHMYKQLVRCSQAPAHVLGNEEQASERVRRLFHVHIPLKLMAFRQGFLKGLEIADDDWKSRKPQGLWRKQMLA